MALFGFYVYTCTRCGCDFFRRVDFDIHVCLLPGSEDGKVLMLWRS